MIETIKAKRFNNIMDLDKKYRMAMYKDSYTILLKFNELNSDMEETEMAAVEYNSTEISAYYIVGKLNGLLIIVAFLTIELENGEKNVYKIMFPAEEIEKLIEE